MRELLIALFACSLAQTAVSGQVTGVVSDSEGRALPGATVELWSQRAMLASRVTKQGGDFEFEVTDASAAIGLYVAMIGYAPQRLPIPSNGESVSVALIQQAIPLPELVANVAAKRCPNEESPHARALWKAAQARYRLLETSAALGTRLLRGLEVVAAEQVGSYDIKRGQGGERGSIGFAREQWRKKIEKEGYAWPITTSSLNGVYESREYPPLEADFAEHFADTLFGSRHRLSVAEVSPDGWTLAFCPLDKRAAEIEGQLVIGIDTTFHSAEWRYRLRKGGEDAGGRVVFAPAAPESLGYLLALEGVFWRRRPMGDFTQHWQVFREWQYGPNGLNSR